MEDFQFCKNDEGMEFVQFTKVQRRPDRADCRARTEIFSHEWDSNSPKVLSSEAQRTLLSLEVLTALSKLLEWSTIPIKITSDFLRLNYPLKNHLLTTISGGIVPVGWKILQTGIPRFLPLPHWKLFTPQALMKQACSSKNERTSHFKQPLSLIKPNLWLTLKGTLTTCIS